MIRNFVIFLSSFILLIFLYRCTDLLLYFCLSGRGYAAGYFSDRYSCIIAGYILFDASLLCLSYNSLISSQYMVIYFLPFVPPSIDLYILPHFYLVIYIGSMDGAILQRHVEAPQTHTSSTYRPSREGQKKRLNGRPSINKPLMASRKSWLKRQS